MLMLCYSFVLRKVWHMSSIMPKFLIVTQGSTRDTCQTERKLFASDFANDSPKIPKASGQRLVVAGLLLFHDYHSAHTWHRVKFWNSLSSFDGIFPRDT